MTEEAKKNLLNYMLGKMPSESGVEEEIFQSINETNRSVWEPFLPSSWNDFHIEGSISPNETSTRLGVMYGGYIDENNDVKGIIILFDENFMPVKTFYSYDSGTDLRYIQCMKQAEDETFYMIDSTNFSFTASQDLKTSEKRFVMLNNFTIKNNNSNDYNLNLRTSYIFGTDCNNFYCQDMFKDVNSSHYVFCGKSLRADITTGGYLQLSVIDLKINVGSTNEWQLFTTNNNISYNLTYLKGFASFDDNDNFLAKIITTTGGITGDGEVYNWQKGYEDDNFTLSSPILSKQGTDYYVDDNLSNQCIFKNENEIYFVINNQIYSSSSGIEHFIALYYCNLSTNKVDEIYYNNFGISTSSVTNEEIYLSENNGTVYVQFNNNIDLTDDVSDYYMQRFEGVWEPKLVSEKRPFFKNNRGLLIKLNYNLLQIYMYPLNMSNAEWYLCNIKEIYNPSNYNGNSFINTNSLNSNSAVLYSDNNPVFARNLYNKTQNGATTTSTIEIPNNYLNDTLVDQKDLMSVNNNVIISDTNGFTKNVYETVYLNFVNTISVVNQNNTQSVYNNEIATKLNTSINNPTDYDDLKLTKFRVNYQDGTNTVSKLQATLQDDGSYQLLMTFYLSKLANTLELISEDEQTVYLTYNLTNTEINKTYSFKQRIRIGGN